MNILDRMDLLSKLRSFKKEVMRDRMLMEDRANIELAFQQIDMKLEEKIKDWMSQRGDGDEI